MNRFLIPYAATLAMVVALNMLWWGVMAKPLYLQGIGHLMAEHPNVLAAAIFYAVFALGLLVFVVLPEAGHAGLVKAASMGALFGCFAYATYDLVNLATLKNWPISLAVLDMAWGTLVGAIAAATGAWMLPR